MALPGMIDTDEVRATIRKLTDALFDYLTLDIVAYERAAKLHPAGMTRVQIPAYDIGDELKKALDRREELQERIAKVQQQIADSPEVMRNPLELTILQPFQDQLQFYEDEINRLQKRIEETQSAS